MITVINILIITIQAALTFYIPGVAAIQSEDMVPVYTKFH